MPKNKNVGWENEPCKIRTFKSYMNFLTKSKNEFQKKYENNVPSMHSSLSEYQKLDVIGKGTYGVVLLYRHKATGTYIACKRILKANILKKNLLQQILHEKKVLYAADFPFVIKSLFSYKDNDAVYYGMPFINGGDMLTLLRRKRKFPEDAARFYGAQVLLAIEYLHFMDIVHRDIKPENILVDVRGYIKLADLGLSKLTTSRLWSFCGTPEYVSPEIIQSKGYGKAVDWWSFGVLLFELCNGRSPFCRNRSNHLNMFNDILDGNYSMPAIFTPALQHLVFNLLQVDTTKRYGCLKNGSLDIKGHDWFKNTNWLAIFNQEVTATIKPVSKCEGDVSNFDKLADDVYTKSPVCKYEEEFLDY